MGESVTDERRAHIARLRAAVRPATEWHALADVQPLLEAATALVALGECDEAVTLLKPAVYNPDVKDSPINQLGEWGEWRQVVQALIGVVAHEERLTHPADRLAAQMVLGTAYERLYNYPQAQPHLDIALALARESGDKRAESFILSRHASILWDKGDRRTSAELDLKALALARQCGDTRLESILLNNIGILYVSLGKLKQAVTFLEQAWKIAQRNHNLRDEVWYVANISEFLVRTGNYSGTLAFINKVLPQAQRYGDPTMLNALLLNKAECLWRTGNDTEATVLYDDCLTRAQRNNNLTDQIETYVGIADLALHKNNIGRAHAAVRRAESEVALATGAGAVRTRIMLLLLEAQTALAVTDRTYDRAAKLYHRMITLAEDAQAVDFQAKAEVGLACIARRQGEIATAYVHLFQAYNLIHDSEDRSHALVVATARDFGALPDFLVAAPDPVLAAKLQHEIGMTYIGMK